ncbi:MAG: hypothetical protein R3F20_10490 [Planctomycetota bacterium]
MRVRKLLPHLATAALVALVALGTGAILVRTRPMPVDQLDDRSRASEPSGVGDRRNAGIRARRDGATEPSSLPAVEASRSPRLRGRVRTLSGSPLAGVRFELIAVGAPDGPIARGRPVSRRLEVRQESQEDGSFELDVEGFVPPYRLVARVPCLATPIERWILGGESEVDLRAPALQRTTIRVRDEAGRPVPSARLLLSDSFSPYWSTRLSLDALGEAEVAWPARDGRGEIWIGAFDERSRRGTLSIDQSGAGLIHEIVLRSGDAIVVRVADADTGRAVGGALVEIHTCEICDHLLLIPTLWAEGRTANTDGALRLDCLLPTGHSDPSLQPWEADPDLEVRVRAPGFVSSTRFLAWEEGEQPVEVRIDLESARSLHGRLVDETGASVAGQLIVSGIGDLQWNIPSDTNGRFRIDEIPERTAQVETIQIDASGFDIHGRPVRARMALAREKWPSGGELDPIVCRTPQVETSRRLEFRVSDRSDRVIAGAWLEVREVRRFADARGNIACEIELEQSPSGEGPGSASDAYASRLPSITFGAPGHATRELSGDSLGDGPSLTVVLERERDLCLVVLDRGGHPVPETRVTLRMRQDSSGAVEPWDATGFTDEQGRFRTSAALARSIEVIIDLCRGVAERHQAVRVIPADVADYTIRLPIEFRGEGSFSFAVATDPPGREDRLVATLSSVDSRDESPRPRDVRHYDRRFSAYDLLAGEYELRIGTPNACLHLERIKVDAGRTIDRKDPIHIVVPDD